MVFSRSLWIDSVKASSHRRYCKQLCGGMEIPCWATFPCSRKATLSRLKALLKVLIYANLRHGVQMFSQISRIPDLLPKLWAKRCSLYASVYGMTKMQSETECIFKRILYRDKARSTLWFAETYGMVPRSLVLEMNTEDSTSLHLNSCNSQGNYPYRKIFTYTDCKGNITRLQNFFANINYTNSLKYTHDHFFLYLKLQLSYLVQNKSLEADKIEL